MFYIYDGPILSIEAEIRKIQYHRLSLPMPMTLRSTKHILSFCVITFMLKYLKSSYFSNKMMDLVNIWYDVRYRS